MPGLLIRYTAISISLLVIEIVTYSMYRKKEMKNPDRNRYEVRMPGELVSVYAFICLLGVIMLVFFSVLMYRGNETVTKGHLVFSMLFSAVGLVVSLFASYWKISVSGDSMQIRRFLRRTVRITFDGIGWADIRNGGITLYRPDRKKSYRSMSCRTAMKHSFQILPHAEKRTAVDFIYNRQRIRQSTR